MLYLDHHRFFYFLIIFLLLTVDDEKFIIKIIKRERKDHRPLNSD